MTPQPDQHNLDAAKAMLDELLPWLALPPVGFEQAASTTDEGELQTIVEQLDKLAVHATRVSRYMDARTMGRGHESAVKDSNRTVEKVRKALGYTYPKLDINY
jgi:hypothetical protein